MRVIVYVCTYNKSIQFFFSPQTARWLDIFNYLTSTVHAVSYGLGQALSSHGSLV